MSISIAQYRSVIRLFCQKSHGKIKGNIFGSHKKHPIFLTTLLLFIILNAEIQTQNSHSFTTQKSNNNTQHTLNGNIKINNLKILHWNKGNSNFNYKINDIII